MALNLILRTPSASYSCFSLHAATERRNCERITTIRERIRMQLRLVFMLFGAIIRHAFEWEKQGYYFIFVYFQPTRASRRIPRLHAILLRLETHNTAHGIVCFNVITFVIHNQRHDLCILSPLRRRARAQEHWGWARQPTGPIVSRPILIWINCAHQSRPFCPLTHLPVRAI